MAKLTYARQKIVLSRRYRLRRTIKASAAATDLFPKDALDILDIDEDISIEDARQFDNIIRKSLTYITEDDIKRLNALLDKGSNNWQGQRRQTYRNYLVFRPGVLQEIHRSSLASLRLCFAIQRECQFAESLLQVAKLSYRTIGSPIVDKIRGLLIDLKTAIERHVKEVELKIEKVITRSLQKRKIRKESTGKEDKDFVGSRQVATKVVMCLSQKNQRLLKSIRQDDFEKVDFESIGNFIGMNIAIQKTERLARDTAELARLLARKIRYYDKS